MPIAAAPGYLDIDFSDDMPKHCHCLLQILLGNAVPAIVLLWMPGKLGVRP